MLQEYNPKNKDVFIHVNEELLPRSQQKYMSLIVLFKMEMVFGKD